MPQTVTPLTSLTATPVGASTLGGIGLAGGAGYMVSRALGGDKKESTAAGAGAAIGTAAAGPIGGVVGGVIGKVVGGRVICNELCKQGLLPKEDVILDLKFTRDYLTDTHAHGYWLYAVPSVKLMRKSKLTTKIWHHIAKNRLDDVKWRLGKGKFNLLGRGYSIILENLSYGLGKLFPNTTYEELYT